jgi:hypothetical protein
VPREARKGRVETGVVRESRWVRTADKEGWTCSIWMMDITMVTMNSPHDALTPSHPMSSTPLGLYPFRGDRWMDLEVPSTGWMDGWM